MSLISIDYGSISGSGIDFSTPTVQQKWSALAQNKPQTVNIPSKAKLIVLMYSGATNYACSVHIIDVSKQIVVTGGQGKTGTVAEQGTMALSSDNLISVTDSTVTVTNPYDDARNFNLFVYC